MEGIRELHATSPVPYVRGYWQEGSDRGRDSLNKNEEYRLDIFYFFSMRSQVQTSNDVYCVVVRSDRFSETMLALTPDFCWTLQAVGVRQSLQHGA